MNVNNSNAVSQSFLNEYKGNLLEFLVSRELANRHDIIETFFSSLDPSLMKTFSQYEGELRKRSPDLLKKLPYLASEIVEVIELEIKDTICNVEVIGKKAEYSKFNEADILLHMNTRVVPLSLKLCKDGSYINTKSGGIKSFFKKYFSSFKESSETQERLNKEISMAFSKMSHELCAHYGLNYDGLFSESFHEACGTELPGELPGKVKKIVHHYYYFCREHFYQVFQLFFERDPELFLKCLYPLIGVGNEELWQLMALYKKNYELSKVFIKKDIKLDLKEISIGILKKEKSYFDLQIGPDILQIRMKPMNKFTVEGLKVNCSVKFG